jgi:predicted GNAT family acetyltransferase
MDVNLPDGTTVKGVPDDMTRDQFVQKAKANGMNIPDEWLGASQVHAQPTQSPAAPPAQTSNEPSMDEINRRHLTRQGDQWIDPTAPRDRTKDPNSEFENVVTRAGSTLVGMAKDLPNAAAALTDPEALLRGSNKLAGIMGMGTDPFGATARAMKAKGIDYDPVPEWAKHGKGLSNAIMNSSHAYQDFMGGVQDRVESALTPSFRDAANKPMMEGLRDPEWYLNGLGTAAAYALPSIGPIATASRLGYATRMASLAGRTDMEMAQKVASSIAAGQKAGAAVGGVTNAAIMGGQTGQEVRDALGKLDEATLMNYPEYRKAREQGKSDVEARQEFISNRANEATLLSGLAAELPTQALNKFIAHAAVGHAIARTTAGAALKGTIEGGVAGALGMTGMGTVERAEEDKNKDFYGALKQATKDDSLSGALFGAVIGGGLAGGAHGRIPTTQAEDLARGAEKAKTASDVQKAMQSKADAEAAEAAEKRQKAGTASDQDSGAAGRAEAKAERISAEQAQENHETLVRAQQDFIAAHERVKAIEAHVADPSVPVNYNELERARNERAKAYDDFAEAADSAGILTARKQSGQVQNNVGQASERSNEGTVRRADQRGDGSGRERSVELEGPKLDGSSADAASSGNERVGREVEPLAGSGRGATGVEPGDGRISGRRNQGSEHPQPLEEVGPLPGTEEQKRGRVLDNVEETKLGGPMPPLEETKKAQETHAGEANEPSAASERDKVQKALAERQVSNKQYASNYADIPESNRALTPDQKRVEDRMKAIVADVPAAEQAYSQVAGTEGGRIINTDLARKLSPDYDKDNQSRALHSNSVQEPSSWLADKLYFRRLAEPPGESKTVLATAGGSDSGKSISLSSKDAKKADIVYDGNMNNLPKTRRRIKAALDSGRDFHIQFTFRDPIAAWKEGVLPRAMKFGRTVPAEAHADTHNGSFKTVMALAKQYANDPRVKISVVDVDDASVKTLQDVAKKRYHITPDELRKIAIEEYKNGRITDTVLRGVAGPGAERLARSGKDNGRVSGKPVGEAGKRAGSAGEAGKGNGRDSSGEGGDRAKSQEEARLGEGVPGQVQVEPLKGMPTSVDVPGKGKIAFGPETRAQAAAADYAKRAGIKYDPPRDYKKVNVDTAKQIAKAYDEMKNDPTDPKVKASYDALIKETLDQFQSIKATGLKIEFIEPGQKDPYAASPRLAIMDARDNNHLWVYPTESGFGGNVVNIGLKVGENDKITRGEAEAALRAKGVDIVSSNVHESNTEPTLVARLSRPLTTSEAHDVSTKLKQESIAQLVGQKGELHGPNAEQWRPFNPDYFLTESGDVLSKVQQNPMLRETDELIGGRRLLANDVFRIVHDYFGHIKEGIGFRADGEENAWRQHAAMYSDLARGAMTTETRGQNSWLNYGPHGENNRTAKASETIYAEQKAGLLPDRFTVDSPEPIKTGESVAEVLPVFRVGSEGTERERQLIWGGNPKDIPYANEKDRSVIAGGGIDAKTSEAIKSHIRQEFGFDVQIVNHPEDVPYIDRWAAENLPISAVFTDNVDGGTVHLIAGNLGSFEHGVTAATHELVGHYGTRAVLGGRGSDNYNIMMDAITRAFPGRVREMAIKNGISMSHPDKSIREMRRRSAAEELVAYAAEKSIDGKRLRPGMFQQIVDMFRSFLRNIGVLKTANESDIASLIDRSADYVRRGGAERMRTRDQISLDISGQPREYAFQTNDKTSYRVNLPSVEHSFDETGEHRLSTSAGEMLAQESGKYLNVKRSDVESAARGQGHGVAMLEKAASVAFERGLKLGSDISVSPSAARLYDALERRGYEVTRNPADISETTGNYVSRDHRVPVFEVAPQQSYKVGREKTARDILGEVASHLTKEEKAKLTRVSAEKVLDVFKNLPDAKEFASAALAGKAKRGWYRESAKAIANVFGPDGPRFTALLSAMSPRVSVEMNLHNALHTFINWDKAGRPQKRGEIVKIMGDSVLGDQGKNSVLGAWIPNAVRALTHAEPENLNLSGPKVNSFMRNLQGHVHEVTLDAWMANFAKIDQRLFAGSLKANGVDPGKRPGYLGYSARVREAAKMVSRITGEKWTPAEIQETIWSWAKTAYETADSYGGLGSVPELVRNKEITDELIRSTPDFKTLFHSEAYEPVLRGAGYGDRLDELRAANEADEQRAASKAEPPVSRALQKHLEAAAERLESLRQEVNESRISTRRARQTERRRNPNQQQMFSVSKPDSPEQAAFLAKINPESHDTRPLKEKIGEFLHGVQQGVFNEFHGIESSFKQYGGEGPNLGFMKAELTRNAGQLLSSAIKDGVPIWRQGEVGLDTSAGGYQDILAPLGSKVEDWYNARVARRAARLYEEGREHNFTPEEIAAGNRLWDQHPEFEKAFQKRAEFSRRILDFAEQAGIIDGEGRKTWENADHVPFYRLMGDTGDITGATAGRSIGRQKEQIKRLKGGAAPIADPMTSELQNWGSLMKASLHNMAVTRVIDDMRHLQMEDGRPVIEAGRASTDIKISKEEYKQRLLDTGVDPKSLDHNTFEHLYSLQHGQPEEPNTIWQMVNGKKVYWKVNDEMLFQSLANLNNGGQSEFMKFWSKWVGAPARLLRKTIVNTPVFAAKIAVRHTQYLWVTGRYGSKSISPEFVPLLNSVQGFWSIMRNSEEAKQWKAAGGLFSDAMSYGEPVNAARRLKMRLAAKSVPGTVLSSLTAVADFYHRFLNAAEGMNRIAIANSSLKAGASRTQAAHAARKVLDYTQKGNHWAIKMAITSIPFTTGHLAGLDALKKSMMTNPTGFLFRGGLLAAGAVAYAAMNQKNPDYLALTDDQKTNYFHFFNVFKQGDHWQIPKSFEDGAIFVTIPEAITNYALSSDNDRLRQAANLAGHSLKQAFEYDYMPTEIRPIYDLATNTQHYSGAPVLSQQDLDVAPQQQDAPYVSPTLRMFAQNMPDAAPDWLKSPKQVQFLASSYIGTMGQYVTAITDAMIRQAQGVTAPARPNAVAGLPSVNQIYKVGPSLRTKYTDSMYTVAKNIAQISATEKKMEAGDEGKKVMDYNREHAFELGVKSSYDAATKQVAQIRHYILQVQQDKNLNPQDKEDRIEKAQESINKIAEQLYKLRPGGPLDKTSHKLIGATLPQKVGVLQSAGLPATASLIRDMAA